MRVYRKKVKAEINFLLEAVMEINEDQMAIILLEIEQKINSLTPYTKNIDGNVIRTITRLHLKE